MQFQRIKKLVALIERLGKLMKCSTRPEQVIWKAHCCTIRHLVQYIHCHKVSARSDGRSYMVNVRVPQTTAGLAEGDVSAVVVRWFLIVA